MQLERIICSSAILEFYFLWLYAVTCIDEDSTRAGGSTEQLSSFIFSNTFLQ